MGHLGDLGIDGKMWLKRFLKKWDVDLRVMANGEFMHTSNEYDCCIRGGKYLDHVCVC